jgi:hypothetical protein
MTKNVSVASLGVDETSFLRANRRAPDALRHRARRSHREEGHRHDRGNAAADLRRWCAGVTRSGSVAVSSRPISPRATERDFIRT